MTQEEFLKRFKDFPMTCKGCEKYSEECDTMDMCIFIRNKIVKCVAKDEDYEIHRKENNTWQMKKKQKKSQLSLPEK